MPGHIWNDYLIENTAAHRNDEAICLLFRYITITWLFYQAIELGNLGLHVAAYSNQISRAIQQPVYLFHSGV